MENKKIWASITATIAASLCCVTPVVAVLTGSSSFASSFAWMEPYHDYLVALTVIVLLYAWWDKLKPKAEEIECNTCNTEGKPSFFSSTLFLGIVTLFAAVILTFPQWGYNYFKVKPECDTCTTTVEKKEVVKEIKPAKSTSKKSNQTSETLSVFKYMQEEKLNPTACNQVACSGSGIAAVDVMLARAKGTVEEMSPAILKKMLDAGEEIILLDVREPSPQNKITIPTDDESYAMTRGDLELKIHKIIDSKESVIITFCRSGFRGLLAAESLKQLGYKHVYNLSAGLKGWARAGYSFMEEDELVNKKENEI